MAEAGPGEMLGTVDNGTGKGPVFRVQLAAGGIGYDRRLWMGQDKVEAESRDVGEHRRNLPGNRHPRNSAGMVPRDGLRGFSSHPNFITMTQVTSNKHNLIKLLLCSLPLPRIFKIRRGREKD